ncbi:Type I Iterative Polyketide synthase (PKS) [Aspergillus melleus]|uniref:Type I Iterative Polyketide synthase (PKS) n=1 Tax=Aspergillus melleus TaxID=138277 RepID=A0ACC3B0L4_9EURO|nr:Type I Iterative Polyketide synthase (PKS) [Aspergillus melleus]
MPSKENGITNGVNGHAHTNGHESTNGHAHTTPGPSPSPIAIVGMACRFAGGRPARRSYGNFAQPAAMHKDKPGRNHATGGYFLEEDVSLFDAAFFNFTAAVANAMDPQLRLLLEVVYEATEDAGIPIEKLAGPESSTSVFTGCYTKDYHDLLTRDPETMPPATLTGNYTAMFSNRLSHYYDFQGASMSIDTGCSAALAALHQGCQTIRSGDSKASIIGASNTILNPDIYIVMSSLGMVGAEGRCYAWDTRAEGYGRGEGVAVLVLKSLDDALRDGDQVHAVIRNSALNQDGNTTTITSPSLEAQTGYVEAHMTGTQAGDATEAESLARTFGSSRSDGDAVWIGGVKTNVGHTEGVSGLAGIIKAAMAMKYQAIPPNLNYKVGNRKIPLQNWNLQVPTSLVDWPKDKPLRASINNFGYGGTNAHVILDGIAEQTRGGTSLSITPANGSEVNISRLYILSAQDAMTTKNMAKNLAVYLRQSNSVPSAKDLAFTLVERRSRLSWVATVRSRSIPELADQLENDALQVAFAPVKRQSPRLGFVFNGQGAQWHAMGRELLHEYPVFAASVKAADEVLREHGATWSLIEELTRDAKSTRVSEIHLGQPITVALQICLVDLLHSWGIYPSAVTSHSSGEIAAAYAAGLLSFEQALGVTYWRGELARSMLGQEDSGLVGGMAAAGLSPDEAQGYLSKTSSGGRVVVACMNSPESVTLSPDLEEVVARVEADGRFARKLKVPVAYHSHHMQVMAAAYTKKLQVLVPSWSEWPRPHVLYTSPVTGGIISSPEALAPTHYVNNLTNPVLFSQAFEAMCFGSSATNVDAVVEI